MMKLLNKEARLTASPLSYIFLVAVFLTFVPSYPILIGAFFVTLGIFYTFQRMRENNDIPYSLLLPVSKADIVAGKYLFLVMIEGCAFLAMTACTLIRMLILKDAAVYLGNELMCANLSFLGYALFIFGLFNAIFVGGFFKTAYYFGKPFFTYCGVSLLAIAAAETLPHIPGLEEINAFGFDVLFPQVGILIGGAVLFVLMTFLSYRVSVKRFEKTDL